MQSHRRGQSVPVTLAAAARRLDFTGTRLDVLRRLSQWSREDREMERWMDLAQLLKEALSLLAMGLL